MWPCIIHTFYIVMIEALYCKRLTRSYVCAFVKDAQEQPHQLCEQQQFCGVKLSSSSITVWQPDHLYEPGSFWHTTLSLYPVSTDNDMYIRYKSYAMQVHSLNLNIIAGTFWQIRSIVIVTCPGSAIGWDGNASSQATLGVRALTSLKRFPYRMWPSRTLHVKMVSICKQTVIFHLNTSSCQDGCNGSGNGNAMLDHSLAWSSLIPKHRK